MTRTIAASDSGEAVRILAAGGLVAIPTETVYGLAARADSPEAVRSVFRAKGRPASHPLIVHVADVDTARRWAIMTPEAERLARDHWPGPLTLLLTRREPVCDDITGGRDTVAVRMPAHDLALRVISELGCPVVAPSANHFGRVSPTTAAHVRSDLDGLIDAVLDGGPCSVGLESTIVDCTGAGVRILRPGAVTPAQVEASVGSPVVPDSGESRAPGMLAAHYAPACRVVVVDSAAEARRRADAEQATGALARVLDPGEDIEGFARRLYEELHRADSDGVQIVIAVLPPDEGLGSAVRDRLTKAAAGGGLTDR